jgi:hypothetical protein
MSDKQTTTVKAFLLKLHKIETNGTIVEAIDLIFDTIDEWIPKVHPFVANYCNTEAHSTMNYTSACAPNAASVPPKTCFRDYNRRRFFICFVINSVASVV